MKSLFGVIYRNLANAVSILGVLPLCLLLTEGGYRYLPCLIVYNNIMDDLDGILASKLGIKSRFGALLDNVCDAVAHTLILMVVAAHYGAEMSSMVPLAVAILPAAAILLRVTSRLEPSAVAERGTPTNELMRQLLFIVLLERLFHLDGAPYVLAAFGLHAVSMLVPFAMPHLIRSQTKTAATITLVNVALVVAWLIPSTAIFVALCFVVTYLYSFAVGGARWLRRALFRKARPD